MKKPPQRTRNHTTNQYIGETFNHSYCHSEVPIKTSPMYLWKPGFKSMPMPQLRFFDEVEVPHDVPFFEFPWRKLTIRKNDNIHPKKLYFPWPPEDEDHFETWKEMLIAMRAIDHHRFADFNIPANIEGEIKPAIKHRKAPILFQGSYKEGVRSLKYQSEDYDTPEDVSYHEISLDSQPDGIQALRFIEGLCLVYNDDDSHLYTKKKEEPCYEIGTSKKNNEETKNHGNLGGMQFQI